MTRSASLTTLLLGATLLAACGGSGGGGSAPVAVITTPPTATPAPTPTPAPAPTPTPASPTLPAGYGSACDGFAKGQSSFAISANIDIERSDRSAEADSYVYWNGRLELADYSDGLSYIYDPKTRTSSTIRMLGAGQPSSIVYTFTDADVVDSNSSRISYLNGAKSLLVTCETGSSISLQRYGQDLRNPATGIPRTVFRYQVSGVPTNGLPNIPSANYASNLSGETFRSYTVDPATRTETVSTAAPAILAYDASTRTLKGTIRLGGSEPIDLTVVVDTLIGSRFSGTVVASNDAKGSIIGGFYGADAREIAYATTFERNGVQYAGAGRGVRN
jgi:hypothetical protein